MSRIFVFTVLPTVGNDTAYNLRNASHLNTIRSNAYITTHFYLPSCVIGMNCLHVQSMQQVFVLSNADSTIP